MARVRSTACPHDDVLAAESEGAVVERGVIDEVMTTLTQLKESSQRMRVTRAHRAMSKVNPTLSPTPVAAILVPRR
jgi:hypothetical protein